jgi:hypothetical protein
MPHSVNSGPVAIIKHRMADLGLKLDPFISKVTNTWADPPMGFGFFCNNCKGLMWALVLNKNFGSDSAIGGSRHKGVSFREINKQSSLHISIYEKLVGTSGDNCSIHLDTCSPVAGVDPKSRIVQYDYGKVLQHIATDLYRTPLIVPSSEAGLVFGIRF